MKKIIFSLLFILSASVFGQSFSVFNIDTTNFPRMKANFLAFDAAGNPINNLSPNDFEVKENGEIKKVTNVSCPTNRPPKSISSVLTIDVSGSMDNGSNGVKNIDLAKTAATAWINAMPRGINECAITSFNTENYFNQDFTNNKNKLLATINSLSADGGTDYNAGFINPMAGALLTVESGKFKRIVVLISDGLSTGSESEIIKKALQAKVTVFCVTLGMNCPQILKNIAVQTGGEWFENVTSLEQAESVYRRILYTAQESSPCSIEWQSSIGCDPNYVYLEIKNNSLNLTEQFKYAKPAKAIIAINFSPAKLYFKNQKPGVKIDTTITITAQNGDFNVSNILSSSSVFDIKPKSFLLKNNESLKLTISYTPTDSIYSFAKFELISDNCSIKYFTSGVYSKYKYSPATLKLTAPNGGESFVAGSDTVISWVGIPDNEICAIDYSINNGITWKNITNTASELKHIWQNVPTPSSDSCLIKIKQLSNTLAASNKQLWKSLNFNGTCAKFSHDGSKIAYTKAGASIGLLNAKTLDTLPFDSNPTYEYFVRSLDWSPDDSRIVIGTAMGIKVVDVLTYKVILEINSGAYPLVKYSPDGTKIASVDNNNKYIKIYNAETGTFIDTLVAHKRAIQFFDWSPDSKFIISVCQDTINSFILWDVAGAKILKSHSEKKVTNLYTVKFSPDGSKFVVDLNLNVAVWDVANWNEVFRSGKTEATYVEWSPDGSKLAYVYSLDNSLVIRDAKTWLITASMTRKTNRWVPKLNWSSDSKNIITYDQTGILELWNIENQSLINTIYGSSYDSQSVNWSSNGNSILSSNCWSGLNIYNAATGIANKFLNCSHGASWSPDASKIVLSGEGLSLTIINSLNGDELMSIPVKFSVYNVKWSRSTNRIAAASDSITTIYESSTGNEVLKIPGNIAFGRLNTICWSADGAEIVTATKDMSINIWNVDSKTKLKEFKGHQQLISCLDLSKDKSILVSGDKNGIVKIWDVNSGIEKFSIPTDKYYLYAVSLSPDGCSLAASNGSSGIIIYDTHTGKKINTISWGSNNNCYANSIEWSPNGDKIACANRSGEVIVWEVANNYLQSDTSDAVFSIVEPKAKAIGVDMGKCLVSASKDSLVTQFTQNIGSYKCRIDSIYIQGADASAFKLIGGFPKYEIDKSSSHFAEFNFKPSRIGVHNAEIVVVTQSETLKVPITGEGVAMQLQIMSGVLDFGKVEVGSQKVFTDTVVVKNISTAPISITKIMKMSPDLEQFDIISGGDPVILNAGETHKMTLRFKPKFGGRTSGRIGFEYNGTGSPITATLFGTGIGGVVVSSSDSAYSGEKKNIHITLKNIKPAGLQAMAKSFSANLKFQGRILAPQDFSLVQQFKNDSITMHVSGDLPNDSTILSIPMIAGLGNVEETSIEISDFKLYDNSGAVIDYDMEVEYGTFKLLGICREGGTRLINPNSQAQILSVRPNPATNAINIEYQLTEKGGAEFLLINDLGETVKQISYAEISDYSQRLETLKLDDLANGRYTLILKTPTISERRSVLVVK